MSKGGWLVLPIGLPEEKGFLSTHGAAGCSFSLLSLVMMGWLCSHGRLLLVLLLDSETEWSEVSSIVWRHVALDEEAYFVSPNHLFVPCNILLRSQPLEAYSDNLYYFTTHFLINFSPSSFYQIPVTHFLILGHHCLFSLLFIISSS
jgi:hypothetical protein